MFGTFRVKSSDPNPFNTLHQAIMSEIQKNYNKIIVILRGKQRLFLRENYQEFSLKSPISLNFDSRAAINWIMFTDKRPPVFKKDRNLCICYRGLKRATVGLIMWFQTHTYTGCWSVMATVQLRIQYMLLFHTSLWKLRTTVLMPTSLLTKESFFLC